jgi:tetratricopeptide (TPR) repeat protein
MLWWQLTNAEGLNLQTVFPRTHSGGNLPSPISPDEPLSNDAALVLLREGDLLGLEGNWKGAQEKYEEALKRDAGLPGLKKLAQAQLQRRDIPGTQNTLSRMRSNGATAEDLLLLETIIELRSGELQKARDRLAKAAESPHKHYGQMLLAIVEGNHDKAKEEILAVQAGWDPILRTYAKVFQNAYDEFAAFPDSPDIHLITLLSRALAESQQCELALPLLAQVVSKQDDYRDAWVVMGYCELTSERFETARSSLERAYNLDPEKPEIQYFLARAHAALEDHQNAITFGQYALKNDFEPQAEVRRFLAREADIVGDKSLAFSQYEALSKLPDADLATYIRLVSISMETSRTDIALATATSAVQKWPDEAKAFELLGWVQQSIGQTNEARGNYERALQIDPHLKSAREKIEQLP